MQTFLTNFVHFGFQCDQVCISGVISSFTSVSECFGQCWDL